MDPANIVSNADEAKRSTPLLASGVILHLLPAGSAYDLTSRTLVPQPPTVDPEDAAELEEAQRDMRQLARDIAAADASPAALRRRLTRTRSRIGSKAPAPEQEQDQPHPR
jgi:cyanophycinase